MSDPNQAGMDIDQSDTGGPKIDGRTREARAARAQQPNDDNGDYPSQRRHTRAIPRQTRQSGRTTRTEARGRDGEILTRRRIQGGDTYHIPESLKDPGWDYQWIAVSVTGNSEVVADQNLQMLENGWRPVMADRFPGRYMPAGHKGHIVRGGQGLYERPMSMSDEARREDTQIALAQMRDRDQSLMGRKANVQGAMGNGMSMDSSRYRGTGGRLQMSIDPALDIAAPQYEPPNDEVE